MRDAAAQVRLRVAVVDLDRRRAVGEALPVVLQLQVAHAAIRVHDSVVLLQAQRVGVVRDGGAVLVGLVRLVALVLLVDRTPLHLDRWHLGQHRRCQVGRQAVGGGHVGLVLRVFGGVFLELGDLAFDIERVPPVEVLAS